MGEAKYLKFRVQID